ncbi:MAG: SUF system NifU family Fe-S cluster assembly protein [Candidatus Krumholzibacteriia bacterium]
MTLQIRFDGERIAAVGVLSHGCAISTASGSMMAELIEGLTVAEAEEVADRFRGVMHGNEFPIDLDLGDLEALEGVRQFPVRIKCALLPWVTLLDAVLAHHQGRPPGAVSTEGLPDHAGPMDVTLEDRR